MLSSPLSANRKNEMEEEERLLSSFPEGHIETVTFQIEGRIYKVTRYCLEFTLSLKKKSSFAVSFGF